MLLFCPIRDAYGTAASFLPKGTPAPFSGLLIEQEKAEQLRKDVLERDQLKLLNDSLNKSLTTYSDLGKIQEAKLTLLIQQRKELLEESIDHYRVNDIQKIFWFVLGAATVGLSVYVVSKATK